jgi:hypothetical protein
MMKAPLWDRLWVMPDNSSAAGSILAFVWKFWLNLKSSRLSDGTVTFYSFTFQDNHSILLEDYVFN